MPSSPSSDPDPPGSVPPGLEVLEERPLNAGVPLSVLADPAGSGLHYVRNHFGIPSVEPGEWSLRVDGAVERERTLEMADLRSLPERTLTVTLECAGNGRTRMTPTPPGTPWTYGAVSTATYTGVPLRSLLERVGLRADAREICFVGADEGQVAPGRREPFARSLSREEVLKGDALLAWAMDGKPLPPRHGRPLRLVVPGWYAMASVKWLRRISARTEPFRGFYQAERYVYRGEEGTPDGTPVARARVRALVAGPEDGAVVPGDGTVIRGSAWSGHAPVERVEISDDAGASWEEAELGTAPSPHAAVPWRFRWRPDGSGRYTLLARATDAAGHTQPLRSRWNELGYGNNVVQRVGVRVG